jgi:hypothetical protein
MTLWPTHRERPVGEFALIEKILAGVPRLPTQILCRKHPGVFDADAGEPCHQRVQAMCAQCGALLQCRNWAKAQPPGTISGVVGGVLMR